MPAFKDKFVIRAGSIDFSLFNAVQEWVSAQNDGNYTIKIDEQRTLSQNRILHVLIEEFRQWILDSQAEAWTPEVAKHMFKIWSGFCVPQKYRTAGGQLRIMRVPKESSKMSKKKFSNWMKHVKVKWYDEFGHIPKTLLDKETADFLGL